MGNLRPGSSWSGPRLLPPQTYREKNDQGHPWYQDRLYSIWGTILPVCTGLAVPLQPLLIRHTLLVALSLY